MSASKDLKALCNGLDRFRVATALGHEGKTNLVCWNQTFQEVTGFANDELKSLLASRILVREDDARPITGERLLGRQEEASRVRKVIQDEVSPDLLAATFGVHSVNAKLQARDAPESVEMARAVRALDQAIQQLITVFSAEQPGVAAV
jgi:hypothetical protein